MINTRYFFMFICQLFLILLTYRLFIKQISYWIVLSPFYGTFIILGILMLIGYLQGRKIDKNAKNN